MIRPIFIAIFVMFFSTLRRQEGLPPNFYVRSLGNKFSLSRGEDAFAAMMLLEIVKEKMTPEQDGSHTGFSIKDNVLARE